MKYAPQLLGALAVALMAGAYSGAAIGDVGMIQRGHTDTLPQNQMVTAGNAGLANAERTPDHYPLVTPEGTVEVAELSLRGRMRSHGYDGWWEARERDEARTQLAAEYDFYETASPERVAHEQRLLAFTDGHPEYSEEELATEPVPERRATRAEAPLALAEPVEVVASEDIGNSKMVDIAAALAAR